MTLPGTTTIGSELRQWREARRLSQLALSSTAGVSTRHLSYVETGRSTPSRDLVLHLAETLDVPLRDRNRLLLAAGYAPVYPERPLDHEALRPAADVLAVVIERSDPHPTVVVDRHWNLLIANDAAFWLCDGVAPALFDPPANVARLSLHPDGLAPRIRNFDEYASHLLARLRRTAELTGDTQLGALVDELETLSPVQSLPKRHTPGPLTVALPLEIDVEGHSLSLFSIIARFGTAIDVTLDELSIETFYPADDATTDLLNQRPWH